MDPNLYVGGQVLLQYAKPTVTPSRVQSSFLQVDLELPGWKEVEDVSGDGGVVKKTLVSTKEWKVRS